MLSNEDEFHYNYDKKIKRNVMCTKISMNKEIKTKRKKELCIENQDMFQRN